MPGLYTIEDIILLHQIYYIYVYYMEALQNKNNVLRQQEKLKSFHIKVI